ncbi:MAG TPA: hypothetical protein VJQ79_12010 [Acidimicrobiia bacterium]|nr:hypothetical protein [Acidimicrobiia bacterium]
MAAVMDDDGYFDVSPTDRSLAILDRTTPVAFHAIWDVLGPVDLEAVAWAWEALSRIHPIMTCTIDLDRDATWRQGPATPSLKIVEGGVEIDQALARELAIPVGLVDGPIVRLAAITHTDGVRFVLGAHHAAFDGAASVFMIDDLRELYLNRVAGTEAAVEPDLSPRTVGSALRQNRLPRLVSQGYIAKSLDAWRRLPPSTHTDPSPAAPMEAATGHVSIDLGPAFTAVEERRRKNSWPIDAVLVGLFESAWNEVFGPGEDGAGVWLVSSNLRPGLGLKRGAGNLSGVEAIAMRNRAAQSVDQRIQQAAGEIAATKSGFPGLGPELMARSWAWMPPAVLNQGAELMVRAGLRQRYTRVISNVGRIPDSLSDWGEARLVGLKYLGPMARGPYCMFVVQSQGGMPSLTIRTARDWFTDTHASQFEKAINRSFL